MADNVTTGTTGLTVLADEVTEGTLGTGKVQMVKIMDATIDGTNKMVVDSSGRVGVVTSGSTLAATQSGTWTVGITATGRTTPASALSVVLPTQRAVSVSSSTSATALSGGSGGAVGDWLDGFLVTPSSTGTGAVTLSDGSTGTARTLVTGGVPNLYPFWVPYPATSTSSAWQLTVGAAQSVTAFGNFT